MTNLMDGDNKRIKTLITDNKMRLYPQVCGFLTNAAISYMIDKGFKYFKTPIVKPQIADKDYEIHFNYKNNRCTLNSSNAMYLGALSALYGNVYTISSTVRIEHDHINHLMEFEMLEAEWHEESFDKLLVFIEDMLRVLIDNYNEYVVKNDLERYFIQKSIKFPLKRISYDNVIDIITKSNIIPSYDRWGFCDNDLSSVIREPVIVVNYPSSFAWRAKKSKNHYSYIANLILPECCGELFECSVRETRYSWYKEKFMEAGISDCYSWYLDSLKYDESSRVGFGLGIERLARWLCDCEKIEYMHAFPRTNMYLD